MPFKVTFQPFLCPDEYASTPDAAAMLAMAAVAHLLNSVWTTVEPCDEDGDATGPSVNLLVTRSCIDLSALNDDADA